jgi:hypothetical protein
LINVAEGKNGTIADHNRAALSNLSNSSTLSAIATSALRTLQTIDELGASPSNTVVLMPVELVDLMRQVRGGHALGDSGAGAERAALDDLPVRSCRLCGRPLDPGAKFCNACGAKVEGKVL